FRSPTSEFTVGKIAASADPAAAGTVDIIILAVKLYDLADATRAMLPLLGPRSRVVTVQNGVTAADEVAAIVGRERAVPGPVFINAHLDEPRLVVPKGRSHA